MKTCNKEDFPVGTRVKVHEDGMDFTATVVEPDPDESEDKKGWIFLRRDDGIEGSGINDEWIFFPKSGSDDYWLEKMVEASSSSLTTSSTHVAGLTPETIDPDAYTEFMRGL